MDEKTTSTLTEVLQKTSPDNIAEYFFENEKYILKTDKPFAAYMRSMFKRKGIKQQDVFLAADISEGYGYKLIAEEKRTRQRDLILRLPPVCSAESLSVSVTCCSCLQAMCSTAGGTGNAACSCLCSRRSPFSARSPAGRAASRCAPA